MHIQPLIPFENELHDSVFGNNIRRGTVIFRVSLLLNYLSSFPIDELPYEDALYGQALFRKWKTVLSHRYGYQYLNDLIFPSDWNKARMSDNSNALRAIALNEATPYLQRLGELFGVSLLDLSDGLLQRPSVISNLRLISEFVARNESNIETPETQPHFSDAIALHQIVTRYYYFRKAHENPVSRLEEFGLFILPKKTPLYLDDRDQDFLLTSDMSFCALAIASRWEVASLTSDGMASNASKSTSLSNPTGQSGPEPIVEFDPILFSFKPRFVNAFTSRIEGGWTWSITPATGASETNDFVLNENELPPHWAPELIMFTLGQESMRRTEETLDLIDYEIAA